MELGSDRSLRVRIVIGVILVVALPVGFVYALVFAINTVGFDLLASVTDRPWNGRVHAEPWLVVAVVVLAVSTIITLAISALFWLGSFALFRTLSQYREFAANRGAAAITGRPAALATALRTVDDEMAEIPDGDLRAVDGGLEALYVAPIDEYQFGGEKRDLTSSDVFPATHPSTDERIERLRDLTEELL